MGAWYGSVGIIDERGRGIASGEAFAGHLAELAHMMAGSGWVTEEPEAHLLPHLEAACDEPVSLLHLDRAWSDGEIFVVELTTREPEPSIGRATPPALPSLANRRYQVHPRVADSEGLSHRCASLNEWAFDRSPRCS